MKKPLEQMGTLLKRFFPLNIDRLKRLVVVLQEVADHRREFFIDTWFDHKTPRFNILKWFKPKDDYCGTVACAMGYAALDPILSSQGLKLRVIYRGQEYRKNVGSIQELNKIVHSRDLVVKSSGVVFDTGDALFHGFTAAEWFFKITNDTARYIFSSSGYKGIPSHQQIKPEDVIRHLNELIENGEEKFIANHLTGNPDFT